MLGESARRGAEGGFPAALECLLRFTGLLLITLQVFSSTSCAKVGDPLPPVIDLPASTNQLRIQARGTRIDLVFPVPSYRIEWVEVYKHCNLSAPVGRFQLVARVHKDELKEAAKPGTFSFSERETDPVCRYGIRYIDDRGQKSEFSNLVSIAAGSP